MEPAERTGSRGDSPMRELALWGGWILLAVAVALGVLGFPFSTHDGEIHVRWLQHFGSQFWQGDLYPRWIPELNRGFGSPAFWHYPPVAFWLGSVFEGIAPSSWHGLGWNAVFGLGISGVGAFLCFRRFVGRWPAALGAVVYMIAPFHLGIDLFNRGANAEFWAFAWMPVVILGIEKCYRGEHFAVVVTTISLALLFATHVLTAMTFAPVAAGYALWRGWRVFGLTCGCVMLAAGSMAVYLLPAVLQEKEIVGDEHAFFQGEFFRDTFFFPNGRRRIRTHGCGYGGGPRAVWRG